MAASARLVATCSDVIRTWELDREVLLFGLVLCVWCLVCVRLCACTARPIIGDVSPLQAPLKSIQSAQGSSCIVSLSPPLPIPPIDPPSLPIQPALRPRLEVQAAGRMAGKGPWHCVKWNHNNQVLACGGDRGAVALLHESGKLLEVLLEGEEEANERGTPTPIVSLAWGGRSRYLCTSGGGSRRPTLWDLKRKQKLRSFKGHGSSTVTAVAFAPDDGGVASGNNHGEVGQARFSMRIFLIFNFYYF
jgi:hypothetical protein